MDLSKAISRQWCKIGGKLVLIINRKSYMSFRLVPKSVTLNNLERRNDPYFELCLSVTRRYCVKTAKRRITQTTPRDSAALVF